jgi:hypothetical protein
VLEPAGAIPVIVEDGCFIGSRCIITEGVRIGREAVLAPNVSLTASVPIIDVTGPEPVEHRGYVPPRSVVVPGTRPKEFPAGTYQLGCALIIGQRTESTDLRTSLNDALREHVGTLDRLDDPRRRTRGRGPCVVDGIDFVPVATRDEPLLERERTGGSLEEGAHRIVGCGQKVAPQACQLGQPRRDRREGSAAAQQLGANEMKPEIAVPELEPGVATEFRCRAERVPRLTGATPAALLVGEAGERVEDRVEVRRHMQSEHLDVVRHVAYYGKVVWIAYSEKPAEEPRSTHSAREHGRLHAAAASRSAVSTLRVCAPSRAASRSRSAIVSTSSMRFGESMRRDSPSAANRAALPGP